jgi:hypothetical protein
MFSQMHSLWNFHLVPDWDRMLAVVHLVVAAAAVVVHIGPEEDLHMVHLCIDHHIVPVEEAVVAVAVAAVHMQEADRMEVSAQATVDQVHPSAAAEDPVPQDQHQGQLEVEMEEVSQVL